MSENEKKEFNLGDILSITTGRMLSPTGGEGVEDIMNFMTGNSLLPAARKKCKPHLLKQFPCLDSPKMDFEIAKLDLMMKKHCDKKNLKYLISGWIATQAVYLISIPGGLLETNPDEPWMIEVSRCPSEPKHTPGAIHAAEIITGGRYGDATKYRTTLGMKTVEGIADLIDREHPDSCDNCVAMHNPEIISSLIMELAEVLKELTSALKRHPLVWRGDDPCWAMDDSLDNRTLMCRAKRALNCVGKSMEENAKPKAE